MTSRAPRASSSTTSSARSPQEQGKPALVEMSCFTIAAAGGLGRIFPEAAFVHSVRDGRDSGSSKVSKRQKSHHPTDAASGVEWWEGRLALAELGYQRLGDPGRLHVTCLDELVWGDREATYEGLLGFLELDDEPGMRRFFDEEMNADAAHRERWREGLDEAEQEAVEHRYAEALERIEARRLPLRRAAAPQLRERPGGDAAGLSERELIFVGGTGRSGTHIVGRLLGSHPRLADVPIEARFHCNKRGMPDLLGGRVSLDGYLTKLREFWWHRVRVDDQPRGLYNLMRRAAFDAAVERFEASYHSDPVAACRELFVELLWRVADEQGKPGLVEMSSHNIREAQTLRRLFAGARFVHTVRDGRDAASSVTTKTWGPDSVVKAIDWWAARLRAIEAGRQLDRGRHRVQPAAGSPALHRPRRSRRRRARARLRRAARLLRARGRPRDPRLLRRRDGRPGREPGPLGEGAGAGRSRPRAAQVRGDAGGARARAQPRRRPADQRIRAVRMT